MISQICFSAIRISAPLIFAALGGLITFQAGILNIALDGFMIVGAFAAIGVAYASESLFLGVLAGMASAMALRPSWRCSTSSFARISSSPALPSRSSPMA